MQKLYYTLQYYTKQYYKTLHKYYTILYTNTIQILYFTILYKYFTNTKANMHRAGRRLKNNTSAILRKT